jgi:hypothetical protein
MTLVQWIGAGLVCWAVVALLCLLLVGNGPHKWFSE